MKLHHLKNWNPPENWLEVDALDVHTEGEPLRIILKGYPELEGQTLLEKRANAQTQHDSLRRALLWEPRGHENMYGAIIVSPDTNGADFGVIFIHNQGYSTGCGHAVIALTKVFVETGLIDKKEPITEVKMDVPSGFIRAYANVENEKITGVGFQNVPSFVQLLDEELNVPELGRIRYDLAFGGAFYAFVDVDQVDLECRPEFYSQLIEVGMKIKQEIMAAVEIKHPTEPDMDFLYGTIFTGPAMKKDNHSRNVCIFANGQVDRSPTGTGVSARAAIHHARGQLEIGESIKIESIIGSTFTVKLIATTKFGSYDAVIPQVIGNAFITGYNRFWINPDDPHKGGFLLK
tara:strand:+ start:4210 stop:5250 length:1041 start_codon:yes stop_codon:yes gene_type:complete